MNTNKFIEEKLKSVEELKPLMPEAFNGELALEVAFKEGYNTAITQALSDAIKYGERNYKDTERLNFLDRMNEELNEHYGTEYGWELILNHNVTRLFSGNIDRIDLNDAKAHGAKSCRTAIDEAIAKLTTSREEG